jgi:hypothetical protein
MMKNKETFSDLNFFFDPKKNKTKIIKDNGAAKELNGEGTGFYIRPKARFFKIDLNIKY